MAELNFYGPFHFDGIDENGTIHSPLEEKLYPNPTIHNLNLSGIYIWGFMYRYDKINKRGLEPLYNVNCQTKIKDGIQFIPYYVGLADITSIKQRLTSHHRIITGNSRKYIRLSNTYMLEFFNDDYFPVKLRSKSNVESVKRMINGSPWKIQYHNNKGSLQEIYKGAIQTNGKINHWPITDQKIKDKSLPNTLHDLPDTLSDLIIRNNNFWFCYAVYNQDSLVKELTISTKKFFENLESYTFWSLMGKTVGEHKQFTETKQNIVIVDKTRADIFKKDENKKVIPSDKFPGY